MSSLPAVSQRTLHVVTHRGWVARDLHAAAAARRPDVKVAHSLGFDAPDVAAGDALWAPMEWAARARPVLGPELLPLADPGARFLTRVPVDLLGRRIRVATVDETAHLAPDVGFFKPANMKVERVPARWTTRDGFLSGCRAAGLPGTSEVMWTASRLDLVEEHRCFVRYRRVVASSPYLIDGATWFEGMVSRHESAAVRFAGLVLVGVRDGAPAAFVLDVGMTREGGWVVVEANPVWCSAQYGCDLAAVVDCLFTAVVDVGDWQWCPDPYLVSRAARNPLPTRRPSGSHRRP